MNHRSDQTARTPKETQLISPDGPMYDTTLISRLFAVLGHPTPKELPIVPFPTAMPHLHLNCNKVGRLRLLALKGTFEKLALVNTCII